MKLDIVQNGEKRQLDLRGLKGKEVDRLMKAMLNMQQTGEDGLSAQLLEYQAVQKELSCKVSGLTLDELDDLDSDDRALIYDYLTEKVNKSMGFTKLLSQ
jgi:hypothetical protein